MFLLFEGPMTATPTTASTSNYLFMSDYHKAADVQQNKTEDQLKVELLRRVKAEKLREQEGSYSAYQHKGFKVYIII